MTFNPATLSPIAFDNNITVLNGHTGTVTANDSADQLTIESGGTLQVNSGVTLTIADGTGTDITVAGTLSVASTGVVGGAGTMGISSGGLLNGTGAVSSALTAASGSTVAPGTSPGLLTVNGNVDLQSGSNLTIEVNGTTAGTDYDQLAVNGTVSLTGAVLGITFGFTPTAGNVFTIIANDGADAVTGTFNSIPEGFQLPLGGGLVATFSYIGGTGNDVTVTIEAPTVAIIKDYQAYRLADGNLLRWQSSYETNNLGFRVYRLDKGVRREVTPSLIAGSALMAGQAPMSAGNSYSWWDTGGAADSAYYIEDIDLDGKTTLHGPVTLRRAGREMRAETGSSPLINELRPAGNGNGLMEQQVVPKSLRGNSRAEYGSDAWATQLALAGRSAVKLGVRHNGWYRVSGAQLQAQGLPADTDAGFLQAYLNGAQVPLAVRTAAGSNTGPLGADGVVEFYGLANDTRESDTNTYWLVAGETPGLRIGPPVRVAPGGGDAEGGSGSAISNPESGISRPEIPNAKLQVTNGSFAYTVERKERSIYFAALNNGDAENFFGPIINNIASQQTLRVSRPAADVPAFASLSVALQGASDNPHQVAVSFNGTQVGIMSFTGKIRQVSRFNVPHSAVREGDNTVTLQALNGSTDVSVTDYLRLTYQHRYEADDNRLLFSAGNHQGLLINGFTTNQVRVFDLTDAGRYFEVAARTEADGGGGYAVRLTGRLSNRQLLAVADNQALSPASIEANEPSSWTQPEHEADFLIVAPRSFRAAAQILANTRQQQGLRSVVVNLEDIFDEWGGGTKDVHALRGFLRYAKEKWHAGPQYLLLLGDASYDPRNYRGFGETDLLPTAYVGTDYLETASDEALTDFNEDGLSEMSVGRLPARTAHQAQALVARVVNYAPFNGGALFVADRPAGYNFAGINEQARNLLPANMPVTNLNREGQSDAALRGQIMENLNAGPSLVQYAGHGSVQVWTSGGVLDNAAVQQLANGARLPLVVAMTCLNGYFHDVASESLAEGLLNAPHGGAIAVWASSALTNPGGQSAINQAFIQALYNGNGMRVGDAARQAKSAVGDLSVRRSWVLFGDPTMRLR